MKKFLLFFLLFIATFESYGQRGAIPIIQIIQKITADSAIISYAQIDSLNAVATQTDSDYSIIFFSFTSPALPDSGVYSIRRTTNATWQAIHPRYADYLLFTTGGTGVLFVDSVGIGGKLYAPTLYTNTIKDSTGTGWLNRFYADTLCITAIKDITGSGNVDVVKFDTVQIHSHIQFDAQYQDSLNAWLAVKQGVVYYDYDRRNMYEWDHATNAWWQMMSRNDTIAWADTAKQALNADSSTYADYSDSTRIAAYAYGTIDSASIITDSVTTTSGIIMRGWNANVGSVLYPFIQFTTNQPNRSYIQDESGHNFNLGNNIWRDPTKGGAFVRLDSVHTYGSGMIQITGGSSGYTYAGTDSARGRDSTQTRIAFFFNEGASGDSVRMRAMAAFTPRAAGYPSGLIISSDHDSSVGGAGMRAEKALDLRGSSIIRDSIFIGDKVSYITKDLITGIAIGTDSVIGLTDSLATKLSRDVFMDSALTIKNITLLSVDSNLTVGDTITSAIGIFGGVEVGADKLIIQNIDFTEVTLDSMSLYSFGTSPESCNVNIQNGVYSNTVRDTIVPCLEITNKSSAATHYYAGIYNFTIPYGYQGMYEDGFVELLEYNGDTTATDLIIYNALGKTDSFSVADSAGGFYGQTTPKVYEDHEVQPNAANGKDAWTWKEVYGAAPSTWNFGVAAVGYVGHGYAAGSDTHSVFVQFENWEDNIPPGATITDATMSLYITTAVLSGAATFYNVGACTTTTGYWTEGTKNGDVPTGATVNTDITADRMPTGVGNSNNKISYVYLNEYIYVYSSGSNYWKDLDITTWAQAVYAGTVADSGIVISNRYGYSHDSYIGIALSDNANTSIRPKLKVSYYYTDLSGTWFTRQLRTSTDAGTKFNTEFNSLNAGDILTFMWRMGAPASSTARYGRFKFKYYER